MRLYVDISDWIVVIFSQLLDVLTECVSLLENIIIFNGNTFGIGDFVVSLFDFSCALVAIGIVVGAFIRLNKADNFYSNRKD